MDFLGIFAEKVDLEIFCTYLTHGVFENKSFITTDMLFFAVVLEYTKEI